MLNSIFSKLGVFKLGVEASLLADFCLVVLVAWLGNFVAKRYLVRTIQLLLVKFHRDWSSIIMRRGVVTKISHFVPAFIVRWSAQLFHVVEYPSTQSLETLMFSLSTLFIILNLVFLLDAALRCAEDIYETYEVSQRRPLRTYMQVLRLILFGVAGIFVFAHLMDTSPWVLITGMGAATAVLLVVFKDSILGFVASVQLSSYDMVRIGDWIEMPPFGADGDVIEINLTTIKVRNFDKTISTIPTAALMSTGVRNWRGMVESGGRRIKRSINIDLESIKFCDQRLLDKLKSVEFLREHIEAKFKEIQASQGEFPDDKVFTINGRRLTNIGLFRAYLSEYLKHNPKIHSPGKGYTFLVRQLQSTDLGLPLEIYVFTTETSWPVHEAIQADIFDHIFAAIPFFELKPFQGSVIQKL